MKALDFSKVVVSKPWGKEFIVFDNGNVAIWRLEIKAGQRTSLHKHPHKLTGIIMVQGTAEFHFMNNPPHRLVAIDKRVIHPPTFHQTLALTDIILLETECPTDKLDLVRLEDAYDRQGKPYEGANEMVPRRDWSSAPMLGDFGEVGECKYWFTGLDSTVIKNTADGHVIVFLDGGMFGAEGQSVVEPGHVTWSQDLRRCLEISKPMPGTFVYDFWLPWNHPRAAS